MCYSPRHDLTLAELGTGDVAALLAEWQRQYRELAAMPNVNSVLIFENKGEAVGVSNPHPHCQIYATNFVFKTIETEARASARYFQETGRVLFQDIVDAEKKDGRRVIAENENAIAFLPYFARYAYEVFVAPKRTAPSLADLRDNEVSDLAAILKETLIRFDNLWQIPFPYVMPLHQAPTDRGDYSNFHSHIEFHPPLRKPKLLKYLAGPEIGGGQILQRSAERPDGGPARAQNNGVVHAKCP